MKDELERRRKLDRDSQIRRELIAAKYKSLHPHVYTLKVKKTIISTMVSVVYLFIVCTDEMACHFSSFNADNN